jgi:hypothetical protein
MEWSSILLLFLQELLPIHSTLDTIKVLPPCPMKQPLLVLEALELDLTQANLGSFSPTRLPKPASMPMEFTIASFCCQLCGIQLLRLVKLLLDPHLSSSLSFFSVPEQASVQNHVIKYYWQPPRTFLSSNAWIPQSFMQSLHLIQQQLPTLFVLQCLNLSALMRSLHISCDSSFQHCLSCNA